MSAYEDLTYEVRDRVAVLTLNRPEKLNAWTAAMEKSVKQAMAAAVADDDVRVIVVTGAGRGFCVDGTCHCPPGFVAAAATTFARISARISVIGRILIHLIPQW